MLFELKLFSIVFIKLFMFIGYDWISIFVKSARNKQSILLIFHTIRSTLYYFIYQQEIVCRLKKNLQHNTIPFYDGAELVSKHGFECSKHAQAVLHIKGRRRQGANAFGRLPLICLPSLNVVPSSKTFASYQCWCKQTLVKIWSFWKYSIGLI